MIRKIFSILLIVFLIPIFLIFLTTLSVKFSILNPNFLKSSFAKIDIYSRIINEGAPALLASVDKNGEFGFAGLMQADDISEIIKSAIPVSFIQEQTEKTIDGFFNFVYGKNTKMEIIIPLTDFKKTASEKFTEKLNAKIQGLPKCTQEEFQELQNSKEGEEIKSLKCWPTGTEGELFSESLLGSITGPDGIITKMPDQYNLSAVIIKNPQSGESIQRFFTIFGKVFQALWIALLVIFGLIIIINRKYPSAMLKWIAIPVLVISSIVLLLSLVGSFVARLFIFGYLNMLPQELKSSVNSLQGDLINQLSSYFLIFSGIFVAICIVMLIIASILNKKKDTK